MILQEMHDTRASLTEKLETLEQKVVGTVENATTAVNDTVDAIKETVNETVTNVNEKVRDGVESVKDLFDLPAHVDQHPWLMLGGSVAVGYALGTLLAPNPRPMYAPAPSNPYPMPAPTYQSVAAPVAKDSMFAPEIAKLKGLALGMLFGTARELLLSAVPEHLGEQLRQVVDEVTKKAGGEPLPSSEWNKLTENNSAEETNAEAKTASTSQPPQDYGNSHSAPRRW
jgi:ElaB/YqjD/DUF883 family membrane-anchored ribosome-binding protein